jgi:hypothetical protein
MPGDHPRLGDDALLDLLGQALDASEPVPDGARQGALDAFAFRDLDASLAELVEDESLASVRGDDDGPLVFSTADVEIVVDRSGHDAVGQLSPPGPWEGRVESPWHEQVGFRADDLGRFRVELAGGPVRLVVDMPDGAVRTDWFRR